MQVEGERDLEILFLVKSTLIYFRNNLTVSGVISMYGLDSLLAISLARTEL